MRHSPDDSPLFNGITTEAGKDLVDFINQRYGSSIWGAVKEMVIKIEEELK